MFVLAGSLESKQQSVTLVAGGTLISPARPQSALVRMQLRKSHHSACITFVCLSFYVEGLHKGSVMRVVAFVNTSPLPHCIARYGVQLPLFDHFVATECLSRNPHRSMYTICSEEETSYCQQICKEEGKLGIRWAREYPAVDEVVHVYRLHVCLT